MLQLVRYIHVKDLLMDISLSPNRLIQCVTVFVTDCIIFPLYNLSFACRLELILSNNMKFELPLNFAHESDLQLNDFFDPMC